MTVEHFREFGAGGDHRGTEGTDRALLPEHCGGVKAAPLARRPHSRADLHMDMPVRITGPARAVRDADYLHVLNGHDLLLPARADTGH